MNGIVLLDEEQQRVLGSRQSMGRSPPPPPPRPRPVHMAPRRGSVQSEGQPRTDFTTYSHEPAYYRSDSLQKPSTTTYNSSPRTNFTTRTALNSATTNHVHGSGDGDSYPILHNHSYIASENGQSEEDDQAAAKYAGTSSGLRISVGYIMAGVAVGVILGLVFAEVGISTNAARWISLPGDLFLRALKCLVIPYVFCAVAVAIGDIVFVGKVSVVGMQTLRMFVFFWVASATIGTVVALSFRPLFRIGVTSAVNKPPVVGFTCPSSHGLVSQSSNGSIVCDPTATIANATSFFITDVNNVFVKTTKTGLTTFTLTDQLMSVITAIVSKNIIASFSNGDLLSIITFSMVLGAVAGRNYFTKSRRVNYLYLTLLQLRNAFFLALEWFIWLSPIAVVSLIAGSFATNADSLKQFDKMYVYVLAGMLATVVQMMVVFPLIVFLLTRCNPYSHMQQMLRAYMFAFACSSSLMTAPVTLACVKKAKVCSQSLGNFVISIGVCSNLSAVGIYIPIAIIFMAEASGNGDQITVLRIIGIFVLSVLACAGTPPIPSGVMVSISTFYTSIFGVSSPPADTLALVIAMDFIIDRFVTVCDVNDDIMCLKVIAENTDETVTQEQLGERE